MSENEFTQEAMDAMTEVEDVRDVRSFADASVMTSNEGFEVQMADGSVFQVTVVQAR